MYNECDTMAYMAKTAYVTARIDPHLKRDAEKILREMGISVSDAVTIFFKQIVLHRKIPFDIKLPVRKN